MIGALPTFVAFAVLAGPPSGLPTIPRDAPLRNYTVQPGDSAWSIANDLYGSGDLYPIIYQYNGWAGPSPFLLTPGQVLKLPVLERRPEAQIEWLRHDVRTKPPRALDWLSAREKMNLWRAYRVSTGDASAAHIVFEDASDLRLRAEAMLVIYGASATAALTSRTDKTGIELEQGTVAGGLARLDQDAAPAKPMLVATPAAEVSILGHLVQIQADALATMVSAYDGAAKVAAAGKVVVVAPGQGTVVKKGKRPEAPRPLPAAPRWRAEPRPVLVVILPGGPDAAFEAAWEPVATAASYRVEVANDPAFDKVLYDTEVGRDVTRLRLAELGAGTWVVRVATRDADRLESPPGPTQTIEVVQASASRRLTLTPEGVLEVVGAVELRAPAGMTVTADAAAPTEPPRDTTLVRLGPGRHNVVFSRGGDRSQMLIDVIDVAGLLTLEGTVATFEARDARGRPALLPGLVIEAAGVGPLPTVSDGARVTATVDDPRIRVVRARWAGGVLATVSRPDPAARVSNPTESPAPPARPMLLDRSERGFARPQRGPDPTRSVGLDLGFMGGDVPALAMVLDGEVAFGALGLDAGLVFADVRFADDLGAAPSDLWLAARWRIGEGAFRLAPRLALALPVGAGPPGDARLTTFELGVGLAFEASALVRLDAHAAALARLGDDDVAALSYEALIAFGIGPAALSARARGVEGEARFDLGLGFAAAIGPVRWGLGLGYDLSGAAVLGRMTLDIGLMPSGRGRIHGRD